MLVLHKWVVYRMKNKRFGNMDQELSATLDGEGVIVGGYVETITYSLKSLIRDDSGAIK